MDEISRALNALETGDHQAAGQLPPLLYEELRRLAAERVAQEKPGQTLQPTALVHEAYLRLVGAAQPQNWGGRGHFFAAAAEAMRRILVERARRKRREKHGGGRHRLELPELEAASPPDDAQILLLDPEPALGRDSARFLAAFLARRRMGYRRGTGTSRSRLGEM